MNIWKTGSLNQSWRRQEELEKTGSLSQSWKGDGAETVRQAWGEGKGVLCQAEEFGF